MSTDALRELALLCQQMRDEEKAQDDAEAKAKAHAANVRRIAEEDIPGLMSELGLKEITLDTGEKIVVALEVYAGIAAANKEAAFTWLEQHGFGSLIKTEVGVAFGREQLNAAIALANELTERGLEPGMTRGVHASTLKSWLKEQIEAEANIPLDLFGARPVNTAKIKAARR